MDMMKVKRKLFFLTTTADCRLTFSERLVYSELAYRAKYSRGATKAQLIRNLRLDPKTIRSAVERLQDRGLACLRGRQWYAQEPSGETIRWFRRRKTENTSWHSIFAYTLMLKPSKECPLTARQIVLYWLVVSLRKKKRRVTAAYLSKLMGVAPQTIRNGLDRLVRMDFLDQDFRPKEQTSFDSIYWQDARKKSSGRELEEEINYKYVDAQRLYAHLREHNIPISLCRELVSLAVNATLETKDVLVLSQRKAEFSRKQREEGKQSVNHHGYLLRTALKSMQRKWTV